MVFSAKEGAGVSSIRHAGQILVAGMVLWMAAASFAPPDALADNDAIRVLMIGDTGGRDELQNILASVRANVADLGVEVNVAWFASFSSRREFEETAVHLSETRDVLAVFWQVDQTLHIFVPRRALNPFVVRGLGSVVKENLAHVIGIIMGNILSVLINDVDAVIFDSPPITYTVGRTPRNDNLGNDNGNDDVSSADASPSTSTDTQHPKRASMKTDEKTPSPDTERSKGASMRADEKTPTRPRIQQLVPLEKNKTTIDATPSPSREVHHRHRLFLFSAYAFTSLSTEHPVVHGGLFGVDVRLFKGMYVTAGYVVSSPVETAVPGAGSLTLKRHPMNIGLLWRFSIGRLWLVPGGLVELDIVKEIVVPSNSHIHVTGNETEMRVGIIPNLSVGYRIVGPFSAAMDVGMHILTSKPRYKSRRNGEVETVYEPWRLQPRVTIGIVAAFF